MCVARHLAERRKSEEYEESDAEVVRQTAVEAEDAWDAELQTFQPASRTTGQSPDLALPPVCINTAFLFDSSAELVHSAVVVQNIKG